MVEGTASQDFVVAAEVFALRGIGANLVVAVLFFVFDLFVAGSEEQAELCLFSGGGKVFDGGCDFFAVEVGTVAGERALGGDEEIGVPAGGFFHCGEDAFFVCSDIVRDEHLQRRDCQGMRDHFIAFHRGILRLRADDGI